MAEQMFGQADLLDRIRMQQFLLTLQSMDLSPFWLGLKRLLSKIAITNRTLNAASQSQVLSSGTCAMKNITIKDEQNNFFVLKKSRKDGLQPESGAYAEEESSPNTETSATRKVGKRNSGKITS